MPDGTSRALAADGVETLPLPRGGRVEIAAEGGPASIAIAERGPRDDASAAADEPADDASEPDEAALARSRTENAPSPTHRFAWASPAPSAWRVELERLLRAL